MIDLHRRHGAASVRLKCRYPVFGDRETRVIVRPYSNVVRSSRLQLAERVRLLYLNDKSRPLFTVIQRNLTSLQSLACTFSSNRRERILFEVTRVNYFAVLTQKIITRAIVNVSNYVLKQIVRESNKLCNVSID